MKVLTTGQTAKALQVSIETVHRLIRSGDLKAERLSRHGYWRIREDSLLEYARKRDIRLDLDQQSQ